MTRILVFLLLVVSLRADATYSTISGTPTNSINFISYEVGCEFRNGAGDDVIMTSVGRWKKSGNSQVHTITVYDASGTAVRTANVDMSGPEPVGTFVFASISPLTVAAGDRVYVLSAELASGDTFWGQQGITNTTPFSGIYIATRQSGVISSQYPNGVSQSYGPVTFQFSSPIASWEKIGNVYYTDGGFYQVTSANADASSGDIIDVPAGTFTWGAGASSISIKAGVTLRGAGTYDTIILQSTGAPTGYSVAMIYLNEGSVLEKMTITGADANNCIPAMTTINAKDWRISKVKYDQYPGRNPYFILVNGGIRGLISYCEINGGAGNAELIFARGPTNAWNSVSGAGDENAIYVENCVFGGQGYVCDANSNGKIVVRFCVITGAMKIDGHGLSTNVPAQGYRRIEAYFNTWTYTTGSWSAFELRGGTNYIFKNARAGTGNDGTFLLRDYGYQGQYVNFGGLFQTPNNYPLGYQAGTGAREELDVEDVVQYQMVRIKDPGDTVWANMGATSSSAGTQFIASGPGTGSGTVTTTPATEPNYIWGNTAGAGTWARHLTTEFGAGTINTNGSAYSAGATSITTVSPGSFVLYAGNFVTFPGDTTRYRLTANVTSASPVLQIAPALVSPISAGTKAVSYGSFITYQGQIGSTSATFTDRDIIQSNRDFFSTAGFDTNTGMQEGTFDDMQNYTPSVVGYGWWVTDRGDWNTEDATPDTPGYQKGQGQLWTWDGADWALNYEPYRYPYLAPEPPSPGSGSAVGGTVIIGGSAQVN